MTYPHDIKIVGTDPTINMRVTPTVTDNLDGSVEIVVSKLGMINEPTSYSIEYVEVSSSGAVIGTPATITSVSEIITISGLNGGKYYRFRITPIRLTGSGNSLQIVKYISKVTSVISSSQAVLNNGATKGLVTLTASEDDFKNNKWSIIYKDYSSINNAAAGDTESYYVFGTTMYMDSNIDNPNQSGAIGFFLSDSLQKGYYLLLETTSLAASANKKELRIVKAKGGGNLVSVKDTQRTIAESLNGIYGGREYIVNVKVKFKRKNNKKTVEIVAYVNGFKLVAIDEDFEDEELPNVALEPTKQFALVCRSGKISFDYAYASSLTKEQFVTFNKKDTIRKGIFDNDLLEVAFGDITYDSGVDTDFNVIKSSAIDEFGTTAREIYVTDLKFDPRPQYPTTISTGLNESVTILGSKMGSFDAEVYLLNNTSSMVPIDASNFYIYGNTISPSAPLEYSTDETSDLVSKEPIIFESKWLQNYDDVKSLANWIKNNVVNKGKVLDLEVFGNPVISVGDIVTVKYQYADLSGDQNLERFIVTNVAQKYGEGGLSTSIACRKIHFSNT